MSSLSILEDGFKFELKYAQRRGNLSLLEQLQGRLKTVIEELEQVPRRGTDLNMLLIAAEDAKELEHIEALVKLVRHRVRQLEQTEMERLIDMAMPQVDVHQASEVLDQARRNAELRAQFLETWQCLDAEGVHALYGSTAENTAALAGKWRKAGKIFGLEYQGRTLYPAFQFYSDGKPKRVIASILKALGPHVGAWQIAIWFTSANPSVGRRRPVDVLDENAEQVVNAAKALTKPNLF